jgi:hypothetical protein
MSGGRSLYHWDTLIKGQPARIKCMDILGQRYALSRGPVSILRLEDEWYEDVNDPLAVTEELRVSRGFKPDVFTFWQRLPETKPRFDFSVEWEEIAALKIESYEHWWSKQVKGTTRNMIRKSQKAGVVIREALFDDDFVDGMCRVFNETPVRQGRRFWHYGKDRSTIREQFARRLFRERLIGAYLDDEMVGFAMLGNASRYGDLGQIISMIRHRNKAINNALIGKAVEICERENLQYLVYAYWSDSSLADFKRHSGFEQVRLPRYFVPMTARGQLAMKLGAHRGWKAMIPEGLKRKFKHWRSRWYAMKETE